MAPHKNKITLTVLFLHFEQPIAVLMHVWADYQTETEEGGYRASIVSLNAIRPLFLLFRAELWMWGNALLLHQSHTHTRRWQLFNSETPLTFSSCCRCGSSHLKPGCSSSRPRGSAEAGKLSSASKWDLFFAHVMYGQQ